MKKRKKRLKMELKQFETINAKLDKIIGLLAIQGITEQDKKIMILKKLGFTSLDVGNFLGLSESTIRGSKGWKEK